MKVTNVLKIIIYSNSPQVYCMKTNSNWPFDFGNVLKSTNFADFFQGEPQIIERNDYILTSFNVAFPGAHKLKFPKQI